MGRLISGMELWHRKLKGSCLQRTVGGYALRHLKTDGSILGRTRRKVPSGSVNRGICRVDGNRVTEVVETLNIIKTVSEDGTLGAEAGGETIDLDSIVSMNFWGLEYEF